MKRDLFDIEKVIGYSFKDKELLITALTHPSYANEHGIESYDRLEFLGDSILDFIVADELYHRYEDKDEGFLTRMRSDIVSRTPLAEIVRNNNLMDYVRISGVNNRELSEKELSNVFESIIGAVYCDGGIEYAERLVKRFLSGLIKDSSLEKKDYKSKLQEYLQERHMDKAEYVNIDHTVNNNIHNYVIEARVGMRRTIGEGKNIKEGEKEAARKMIELLVKNDLK